MAFAIILFLLTIGSILFHFLSPWYFTPLASNWSAIDDALADRPGAHDNGAVALAHTR